MQNKWRDDDKSFCLHREFVYFDISCVSASIIYTLTHALDLQCVVEKVNAQNEIR